MFGKKGRTFGLATLSSETDGLDCLAEYLASLSLVTVRSLLIGQD
jgi:hypothetical protein